MLVVLEQEQTNLSKLAAALNVAPSTAMRMVDRLVGAGLVERTTPPTNRRETLLTLTSAGKRTVRTVTTRRRRDLRAIVRRLPEHQRPELASAYGRVRGRRRASLDGRCRPNRRKEQDDTHLSPHPVHLGRQLHAPDISCILMTVALTKRICAVRLDLLLREAPAVDNLRGSSWH